MRRWMALMLAPLIMLGALVVLLILTAMTATTTAATVPGSGPDDVVTYATTNCAITTAIAQTRSDPTQKINDGMNTAAQTSRRCVLKMPCRATRKYFLSRKFDCVIDQYRPAAGFATPRRCVLKMPHLIAA